MNATARPAAGTPVPLGNQVMASLAEQGGISVFQFAPVVAAALSARPLALAWTASFTAATGLVIALFRGAVVQPGIRVPGHRRPQFSGQAFALIAATLSITLVAVSWWGVFNDKRTLLVLGLAAPLVGIVEINRVTQQSAAKWRTGAVAAIAGTIVAVGPQVVGSDPQPRAIATLWLLGWGALVLRFALSGTLVLPTTGSAGDGGLALSVFNLTGQIAAQGPLLVLAALLPTPALSIVQAARVPLRPVTVLAAALPVHYLPFLLNNIRDRARWRRTAAAIVVSSAVLTVGLAVVASTALQQLASFAGTSTIAIVLASAGAVAAIAEAVTGVATVADGRERSAMVYRIGSAAAAVLLLAILHLDEALNVETALAVLIVGPALAAGAIGRSISWS